jgi:hypothetical protein
MNDPTCNHDVLIVGSGNAACSGMMAGATFGRIAGTSASQLATQA